MISFHFLSCWKRIYEILPDQGAELTTTRWRNNSRKHFVLSASRVRILLEFVAVSFAHLPFNHLFATHRWVKYPARLCSPAFVGNHPGRIKTMWDWCLILHRKFNYTKDGYYPLGHYPEGHYWNRFGVFQIRFVLLYVKSFCLCFVLFTMKHC